MASYFHGDWSWNIFYGHSSSTNSRRAVVSYKWKYVHRVPVLINPLVWACPGSVVRLTNHLNMTIAVDWDIKPQTEQIKRDIAFSAHKELCVHW